MNSFLVIFLTLICLHNLDFMTTSRPVTTDKQTTEQLETVIEEHKKNKWWNHRNIKQRELEELDVI